MSEDVKVLGRELADGVIGELRDELDQLRDSSIELYSTALQVIDVSAQVAVERLTGTDTTLAERSLRSAALSLRAAGHIEINMRIERAFARVLSVILSVVRGVIGRALLSAGR